MRSLEQTAKRWNRGAIVAITQGDAQFFRPAAFVFEAEDGALVWVEPSYRDPYGAASPALHRSITPARDTTSQGSAVVVFEADAETWTAEVLEATEGTAEFSAGAAEAIKWFLADLERSGTTWEEERERVRALVLDN